jgi:ectoine hydroxylase-related dioxygenase (phytanoyl-CoA dioxygenase family)
MNDVDNDRFLRDIEHEGFTVHHDVFDNNKIAELNEYAMTLGPERGHDINQKWHGWNSVELLNDPLNEVDWAYYWTPRAEHSYIESIKTSLEPSVNGIFGEHNWVWHVQDFIVLQPGMNFVRPHIDTPYRFKEWRYNEKLLGLQFMVMMCDFNEWNGATGYVPGSHKYMYDGNHMRDHQESWKIFFSDNCKQFTANAGSMVAWHPRLIHSTMPNKTKQVRRALLLHAAEKITARRLDVVDPQLNYTLRKT